MKRSVTQNSVVTLVAMVNVQFKTSFIKLIFMFYTGNKCQNCHHVFCHLCFIRKVFYNYFSGKIIVTTNAKV